MGKKQPSAAKAAKKLKATQKVEKKEGKKGLKVRGAATSSTAKGKSKAKNDSDTDDDDLEGILERMRKEWEVAHTVTEELVEGPPTRRANATLTACPQGTHLWCIGGELFSEDGRAYFYNDVFRYTPEKDEWRKFVSPTCPGPRSAHAVVASPGGGGKLFLFGGEFSSLHQNTFHHYRDFWCFDVNMHQWDRIDTKIRPSARSGHRMAVWKHLIVLFGGFYDPGIVTRYLNDLWIFDAQEYTWTLIEFKETDARPSPRSGFSFLSCPDGIVLHGGYYKEYLKGKRPVGIMLEDTWLLKITPPSDADSTASKAPSTRGSGAADIPKSLAKAKATSSKLPGIIFKWEKRKRPSDAYAPSLRSGCTMTLWAAKGLGILFGGVTDEDTSEEVLESVFYNDLYGYQLTGKGKWTSLTLKKPRAKGSKSAKKNKQDTWAPEEEMVDEGQIDSDGQGDNQVASPITTKNPQRSQQLPSAAAPYSNKSESDDPLLTTPLVRYNAMLAVLRNTLYIYGGIYERGSREYTLDDFHSLALDKMDRYVCLKKSDVVIPEGEIESSSDDDDEDDDEDDNDAEYEDDDDVAETLVDVDIHSLDNKEAKEDDDWSILETLEEEGPVTRIEVMKIAEDKPEDQNDIRNQATAFMGVSKDITRSAEDVQSTPLPGETLAMFYARSRDYWTQKAHGSSDNKGKLLRRDGFALAEERYAVYKPILKEVEKILEEAGLDEDEMRQGAAGGSGGAGSSRNRR